MSARAKAIAPLAVVIGILSFLWTELSLNFTFHWVTVQDDLAGDGQLGLPENFHLILPTAFISWGLFFAAGGDNAAFGKIFLAPCSARWRPSSPCRSPSRRLTLPTSGASPSGSASSRSSS